MPRVERSPPSTLAIDEHLQFSTPNMDKSLSDTDINLMGKGNKPTPNYVLNRKRTRDKMDDSISNQLDEFKREMRQMLNIFTEQHGREIQQINITLKEIQQSNTSIENSIAYLTGQNEELHEKIKLLEKQAKEDKKNISMLETKIEEFQIGSRKSNFILKNVPRRSNEVKEDLIEMIMCLTRNLDCNIAKSDIKDIYRSHSKDNQQRNTPIIVETGSTLLKAEVLKMSKAYNIKHKSKLSCKHLGMKTNEDTPIYLSEHLTPRGSRLHFLARDLTRSGLYKYCWTAYGKVYVRRDDQSPFITIRSEDQIHQLRLQK